MDAAVSPPLPRLARVADLVEHQARLDQPLVSYRLVAPATRSPAPPPAFMFGPSDPELTRQMFGQVEMPELGCTGMAGAAIAPTGIGIRGDVAFAAAALNHPREHVETVVRKLNEMALPVREVPGPAMVIFGPAEEDLRHLLVDYLPRLWLLTEAGYDFDTVHVVVPRELPPALAGVLDSLGIQGDRLIRYAHWEEVLRTEWLLLPTVLRRHERLHPYFGQATNAWTARVRATLGLPDPAPLARLYIPEPHGATGGLRNRNRIEAIAERAGYTVTPIECLSWAQRAALFGGAARIVGPYSSALHHNVFAAPGLAVCALRGTGRDQGTLQTSLCHALGQRAGYVFGTEDGGGLLIDEADFRRALDIMELPA